MNKQIDFFYGDNNSEVFTLIHPSHFVKTAASSAEYSDELKQFIQNLKSKNNFIYALVNALGAGEYYGSNRNGDYFASDVLKKYHKTFEELAGIYKHHVNKDKSKSLGNVIFSHYNPIMHRVELILELDKLKAKDIVDRLTKGDLAAVSMGSRVSHDICSICGNKAKNRAEYCDHLTTQMNKILSDGRKVYAINPDPKFFDISIVTIPADPTAGFIKMFSNLPVASDKKVVEKLAFFDNSSYIKLAHIKKEIIPLDEIKINGDPKKLLGKLPLQKLSSYPLKEILGTLLVLRIVPLFEDFIKLVREQIDPEEIDESNYNEKIAEVLIDEIPKLSLTKELVAARSLLKVAEQYERPADNQLPPNSNPRFYGGRWNPRVERSYINKALFNYTPDPVMSSEANPALPMGILSALYAGYLSKHKDINATGFKAALQKNPWLIPLLAGGGVLGSLWAQDRYVEKNAMYKESGFDRFFRNSLIAFPVSYYLSGRAQNKALRNEPISGTENFVREHPMITALVGALAAGKIEKAITKTAGILNKMPEEKFNKIYNDIVEIL